MIDGAKHTALVIGATGVTGTPLIEQLLGTGWSVAAVSRRTPQLRAGVTTTKLRHVAVDLSDADRTRAAFAALDDVTHLFYCANDSRPDTRLRLLNNVFDGVEPAAPDLVNVNLLQGTKYYGCHLGPFKVPAQESDARIAGADFYYSEEDFVRARQRGKGWTWTALRPHAVCGYAAGNPMNLAVVLAIYGSICKALGKPFAFPANAACFEARYNVVEADLLARAAIWCSTNRSCGNEAFNVNNGDVFRWRDLWPRLAAFFGLEAQGPGAQPLPAFLAAHEQIWRMLSDRHKLKAFPYQRAPSWTQGDYRPPSSRLACEYDVVSDLGKLRAHGFFERCDSGRMFTRLFARLRHEQVIP